MHHPPRMPLLPSLAAFALLTCGAPVVLAPGGGLAAAAPPGPASLAAQEAAYVPGPAEEWERRRPVEVGMDSAALAAAIRFAIERESPGPRDLELAHVTGFGREPYGEGIGPFKERGTRRGS